MARDRSTAVERSLCVCRCLLCQQLVFPEVSPLGFQQGRVIKQVNQQRQKERSETAAFFSRPGPSSFFRRRGSLPTQVCPSIMEDLFALTPNRGLYGYPSRRIGGSPGAHTV